MPAEAHRVRERDVDLGAARLVGDVVEVALRVGGAVVDGRRKHALAERERRTSSPRPRRPRRSSGRVTDFVDETARPYACVAEDLLDRPRLGEVAERRRGPVRVDVADPLRLDARAASAVRIMLRRRRSSPARAGPCGARRSRCRSRGPPRRSVAPRARAARAPRAPERTRPRPSRSRHGVASNGRDASVGSSSSATRPRIAQKPARISGMIGASVPPASTTSASPRRIVSAPSPIAVRAGGARRDRRVVRPAEPELDRDLPARRVDEHDGMKNGETRSCRARARTSCCSTIAEDAADRRADEDPDARGGRRPVHARVVPCLARRGDGEQDVPLDPPRLLRRRRRSPGSKPLTSAAMRTGKSLASNASIQSTPLRPATAASQVDCASSPSGVTAPRPVTTTRRMATRA